MKYRMAIRYFMMNHEIWYHEIPYGHTVFHDSMKFHEIPYGHTVFYDSMKYRIVWPYGISWNHEIPYGHTIFHDTIFHDSS